MDLQALIDRNNQYDVDECNRLSRSLGTLREMHSTVLDPEKYDAILDARCCCAIRLDTLRDRIAEAAAPWFEVR